MPGARVIEIRVDGTDATAILDDLIELEVCDPLSGHHTFSINIAIRKRVDGTWTHLDPGSAHVFELWQRVTVSAGFGTDINVIFDGYVAGISPFFAPDEAECSLLIWGYGASWSMDQDEKLVAWADTSFSDVAKAIFQTYNLTPKVTETKLVHKEVDELLVQRGTDWSFLTQLARRVGFELYVEGASGVFREPELDGTPQKDMAAYFGPTASNLVWFRPVAQAGHHTEVALQRINRWEQKVEKAEETASPLRLLARQDGPAMVNPRRAAAFVSSVRLSAAPVTSLDELAALAKAVRSDGDWLVTGEGELDGNVYGQILRAKRLVNIKGVGEPWSGRWYVTRVTHTFGVLDYRVLFEAARNGLGLKGDERFQTVNDQPAANQPVRMPDIKTARAGKVVKE